MVFLLFYCENSMHPIRKRSEIDERHMIRDPIRIDPVSHRIDSRAAACWANTLVKTRIPHLFDTRERLAGHVQQLQNELNRCTISKLEGCPTDGIGELIRQIKFVRDATKKAIAAARQSGFPMPNNLILEFHCISDQLKI